jgi:hypothetical protein
MKRCITQIFPCKFTSPRFRHVTHHCPQIQIPDTNPKSAFVSGDKERKGISGSKVTGPRSNHHNSTTWRTFVPKYIIPAKTNPIQSRREIYGRWTVDMARKHKASRQSKLGEDVLCFLMPKYAKGSRKILNSHFPQNGHMITNQVIQMAKFCVPAWKIHVITQSFWKNSTCCTSPPPPPPGTCFLKILFTQCLSKY